VLPASPWKPESHNPLDRLPPQNLDVLPAPPWKPESHDTYGDSFRDAGDVLPASPWKPESHSMRSEPCPRQTRAAGFSVEAGIAQNHDHDLCHAQRGCCRLLRGSRNRTRLTHSDGLARAPCCRLLRGSRNRTTSRTVCCFAPSVLPASPWKPESHMVHLVYPP